MRKLGGYAGLFVAIASSSASDEASWFSVPHDESALVVFAETHEPTVLYATDAKQTLLDKFTWEFGFPLIRQYRLEPGDYRVVVTGVQGEPVDVKLDAGQLTYLRIAPDQNAAQTVGVYPAAYEPIRSNVSAVVSELTFKGYGAFVEPQRLELAEHTLYLNTDPPWPMPPPPQQ